MLYWFTALTEQAQLIPESSLQGSIQILNAQCSTSTNSSSTLQIGIPTAANYTLPQPDLTSPPPDAYYGFQSVEDILLEFKPWLRQNHLGGRAWSGILLPERLPVVIKCWDSYRHNADLQKTEADIYLKLQGIWGICVPKFIAFGRVGFCHAIILERVEVIFQYLLVDGRLRLF